MAEEPHAGLWQNAADYTAKIIKTYSEDIGMYAYPKIVVADARDGMEYPMLTLDGGYEPNYRYLFAHEVGHQWFYGMVGNNETYRAALDEGFTQFLTAWSLVKIDGDTLVTNPPANKYVKRFTDPPLPKERYIFNPYTSAAIRGEDGFINTHSDKFNGALGHGGGYGMVYYKTAEMLYNLQYVLGDSLFLASMQHYFNQWKFCHPYFEDFRNSIIHFTHVELNWFFDQWMETDKRIDYGIKSVKHGKSKDDFLITFDRKERMEMPIDFSVYSKNGIKYDYYIPNRSFIKETNATVLPKWFGWDKIDPTYTAQVHIPDGIKNIAIDTTGRLADIDMLDNRRPFPARLIFDSQIYNPPQRFTYLIKAKPDIWYNDFDGFKIGFHADGNYFGYSHFLSLDVWANTGLAQNSIPEGIGSDKHDPFSYRLTYHTPTDKIIKNSSFNLNAKWLDGLMQYSAGGDVKTKNLNTRFYFDFQMLYRQNAVDTVYLLYPGQWQPEKYNNTATIGMEHTYTYQQGSGDINLALRSSSLASDYNYSYITMNAVNRNAIGKFDFNTRVFAQYGTGTSFANESMLFLAGSNPEDLMNDEFTRSRGFVPDSWLGYGATTNHFQEGGGLNLRGYAGYLVAQTDKNGFVHNIYNGTSGASVSGELAFDRMINLHPAFTKKWLHFTPYFFGDAGVINDNIVGESFSLSDLRADAGLGIALTIKKFGPLQTVKPFTLRFDAPLVLNRPPADDPDYVKFRWVVGVGRIF
jgi:aminopeptidase N